MPQNVLLYVLKSCPCTLIHHPVVLELCLCRVVRKVGGFSPWNSLDMKCRHADGRRTSLRRQEDEPGAAMARVWSSIAVCSIEPSWS